MSLRPCLFLVASLLVWGSSQAELDIKMSALEPLRHVPEIVRSYPFNLKRYAGIFDFLLSVAMEYVYANNMDRVSLPSVEKSVTVSVKGFSYSTSFSGKNGFIENLSTLARVSNVTVMQYRRDTISMSTSVSFQSLTVAFEKYYLPLGFLASLSGEMNMKINKNRIGLKMLITVEGDSNKCGFSLEDLRIEELGDIASTVTGLYPFNWLLSIIVSWVIKDHHSIVRGYLEGKFSLEARYFIMQIPCGHIE